MNKGWCLIPPSVLFDAELNDSDRMLYGKLLGLTNKTGYCWASNKYLADCFHTSERSIQRRLGKLGDRGYIKIEHEKSKRYISVSVKGGDSSVMGGTTDLSLDSTSSSKENNKLNLDLLSHSVWKYWGEKRADRLTANGLMARRRIPPLSRTRREVISVAHRAGYTEEEMIRAIDYVLDSDFHLENGHTDLTLCLRLTKIESYLINGARADSKPEDLQEFA